MKILQVNCVFQKGSTGKIVNDIHVSLLKQGLESVVCYGRGAVIEGANIYKFCTEIESKIHSLLFRLGIALPYGGMFIATKRLISIIKNEKPEVVHLQCINGSCVNVYRLLKFLGEHHIKTVVTHHAEFFYTGSCGYAFDCTHFMQNKGCVSCPDYRMATRSYTICRTQEAWKRMKRAFSYFDKKDLIFTSVSAWVKNRSALSPITNQFSCDVVMNGIETSIFNRDNCDYTLVLDKIPKYNRHIALHVTASFVSKIDNIKGGRYIVELANKMPDTTFVVVASHSDYEEELPSNLFLWGQAASQAELASLYGMADVTVIASKRETFSMIVAESLCCGTPIVGFCAGGPETISIPDFSSFVEYGNVDLLQNAVCNMLDKSFDRAVIASTASNHYSKEVMTGEFIKTYQRLIKQK